jgi:hypothetical protein
MTDNVIKMPATSSEALRLWSNGWLAEHFDEYAIGPISRAEWEAYAPIAEAIRNGSVRRMLARREESDDGNDN